MHEDPLRDSRRLPHLRVLRLSGADAKPFLQGQLSADVLALTPESVLLASCNSAQGRVQAVLWLLERGEEVLLVTSAELIETIAARLKKYVLRAKVKFEPETLHVYGLAGPTSASPLPVTGEGQGEGAKPWTAPLTQTREGDINVVHWPGSRTLLIAPARDTAVDEAFVREWQLADIQCGVPMLHTQTHERFVAQMLNLDLLGGISFEKGCYTGQEIIARTHYRGTVKRRMLRYTATVEPPAPGTRIVAAGEAAGEVVTTVATPQGCELLAVVQLSHVDQELSLDGVLDGGLTEESLPYAVRE